jgi:hypothetical protein
VELIGINSVLGFDFFSFGRKFLCHVACFCGGESREGSSLLTKFGTSVQK